MLKSREKEEYEEEENGRNLKKNFKWNKYGCKRNFFYSTRNNFCEKKWLHQAPLPSFQVARFVFALEILDQVVGLVF